MVLNPMTMTRPPYDPAKDFLPVAIFCVSTTSIVVHPSVPAKSLKELIAYAKANPNKLSYGSAGTGTLSNLSGELFKQLTGLSDLQHISYRGAGPGITDLVAGHIPIMTPNVTGPLLEFHRAGKMRVLAVNSAERLAAAPEIPTAIEEGLPNMIAQLFLGVFVHAGTPKPDRRRRSPMLTARPWLIRLSRRCSMTPGSNLCSIPTPRRRSASSPKKLRAGGRW